MYDKILVAVDHSEISGKAVLAARDLALLSTGEVWVLNLREREIVTKTAIVVADETADEAVPASVLIRASSGALLVLAARDDDRPRRASTTAPVSLAWRILVL